MRITFVLPKFVDHPVGGYRVIVDYANELAKRGHRCTIAIPLLGIWNDLAPRPPLSSLARAGREALASRLGIPWAQLEPGVSVRPVLSGGRPGALPDGDVIVASAWSTAASVQNAPARCGAKLYFIQHYETAWAPDDPDVVRRTWQLPMRKGVIAKWLVELGAEFGEAERVSYVPNGIDLTRFRVQTPVEDRDPARVGMLLHASEWKGTDIGLAALELARAELPQLQADLYGASGYAGPLPDWAHVSGTLSGQAVVDYFNSLAIFVHPSLTEGWGLPPAEAMACGAAVVAADNDGVMDYAVDGVNAAVVPRGSAEALAEAIIRLIRGPQERIALARGGLESIQAYGVDVATDRFEALLSDVAACDH